MAYVIYIISSLAGPLLLTEWENPFNIESMTWKLDLAALLCLSGVMSVVFLTVLWVGLQCLIVVFPDHTHFLCLLLV